MTQRWHPPMLLRWQLAKRVQARRDAGDTFRAIAADMHYSIERVRQYYGFAVRRTRNAPGWQETIT